ncbi:MAG: hypothetical protein ACREU6_05855 [Steroidobacteraceae bacterium]
MMTRFRLIPSVFMLLLGTASIAQAQWASGPRVDVTAGYSDTLGNTANYLQGGYAFGVGLTLSPSWMHPFDLRFDVNYSGYNATIALINNGQQATNQPIDSGTGTILSGNASLLYHIPIAYGVRAYGVAGVGAYYTRIELDQALPVYGGYGYGYGYGYGSGYGYGYGFGYGEAEVAAHGVTNFGWNAGVGIEFALPQRRSWFIEARYEHVNSAASISVLPIEVGFRF